MAPERKAPRDQAAGASASDAPITRALSRTLVILVLVGLLVAGATFVLERFVAPSIPADGTAPSGGDSSVKLIPEARFTDITRTAGLVFVHTNGASGDKLLPETMGGGVAFFDADNDGDQDLLFVNGTFWPWAAPPDAPRPTHALWQNDGHGRFTDATTGSGLDFSSYGMGVGVGDYDDDGWVDVVLTGVGGNHLLRNEGGLRFRDVTEEAGLKGSPNAWSTSAAWFDFDRDGDLDLFICNYLRWSREIDFEADYRLPGIGRAYGQPWNFPATFPYLYRNEGNGRFTDVSAAVGVQVHNRATGLPLAKSLGVKPVDLDADGWIDLIVANDTVQNLVFHNERNGTFREIGAHSGIAYDSFGGTRGAMGIDAACFDEQNTLGISIGNFANEMTAIYVARDNPLLFTDDALDQGIGQASRLSLTFGVFFFDYDLDGWLDLLTANGHIENDIEKVQRSQRYRQPAQLFWNSRASQRTGKFLPVPPAKAGPDLFQPIVGRGSAFADIDGDGDLDVVLTQINGPPLLLRNDQALHHHWLRLKLVGAKGNRDAIGATLQLRIGNRLLVRHVMPARGYLSQSELPVTIGLDTADHVDDLTVTWPDGLHQKVAAPRLDNLTLVVQGR